MIVGLSQTEIKQTNKMTDKWQDGRNLIDIFL